MRIFDFGPIYYYEANDRAVMAAYGFKPGPDFTESTCVAKLLELYQELTK